MDPRADLLRPREVAERLGCSRSRVYKLIADGAVPSVRIANAVRIPRDAYETWLSTQTRAALGPVRNDGHP